MTIGIDARLIHETGVGRYIRNLLRYLGSLSVKHSYVVYTTPAGEGEVHRLLPGALVRVTTIRWHTLAEQLILPFLFSRDRLTVLHVPYFSVPILYQGNLIVTIHDLTPFHVSTGNASTLPFPFYALKKIAYRFIVGLAMKKASYIIAVSETTKKEIESHFPREKGKIRVISEGIDESLLSYRGKKLDNPVAHPYFLYVGNVYPHKNVKTVLLAFEKMKQNLPKAKSPQFIFVGKKDAFMTRLQKEVGADPSIRFFTDVADRELASFYTHAIALVFPSDMEGFGLPAIEAIAFGCPVILSDIPIFRELFFSVGVFAPPRDSDTFARLMGEALSGRISRVSASMQKTYIDRYQWKTMAEQTLKLYEDCVGV